MSEGSTILQRVWLECGHIKLIEIAITRFIDRRCVQDQELCSICLDHPLNEVVKVEDVPQVEMREFWQQEMDRIEAMVKDYQERNKR